MREKRERQSTKSEACLFEGFLSAEQTVAEKLPPFSFFDPDLTSLTSLSLLNSHKKTFHSVKLMFDHVNPKNGERAPLVAEDIYQIVSEVKRESCSFSRREGAIAKRER